MKNNIVIVALLTILTASCSTTPKEEPQVRNVIYLIGDGMGFGAVTSLLLTEDSVTGFEQAPVTGFVETGSADNYVTDSPAGGTALATGVSTKNGYIGLDPEGNQLTSIMRKAQAMGMKSGIVVNTTLTEATPAAFYAGVTDRGMTYEIAKQFTESGIDVAIGSGLDHFIDRPDSLDLTATLIGKGYDVYLNWGSVLNTDSDQFIGILPMADIHRRESGRKEAGAAAGHEVCLAARLASVSEDANASHMSEPNVYLQKASAKALEVLSRDNDEGFFLMIESAIIDGYGHNNDSEGMIAEMGEFDATLRELIAFVDKNPETLLVVTADHDTGGPWLSYTGHKVGCSSPLTFSYSTRGHTGIVVPVFAYGAGAESFSGAMKNVDIPKKIEALIKPGS